MTRERETEAHNGADGTAIELSSVAAFPTSHGTFKIRAFRERSGGEHVVVFKGDLEEEDIPVRIHSECLTSEVFHSLRCDCGAQLSAALAYFEAAGKGILIYLRQEGRGIGLHNKIEAYALQDAGFDTVEANEQLGLPKDSRCYRPAVELLRYMKIRSISLLTNNPKKLDAMRDYGIEVRRRIPLCMNPTPYNDAYLQTKKKKLDHLL